MQMNPNARPIAGEAHVAPWVTKHGDPVVAVRVPYTLGFNESLKGIMKCTDACVTWHDDLRLWLVDRSAELAVRAVMMQTFGKAGICGQCWNGQPCPRGWHLVNEKARRLGKGGLA